MKTFCIVSATNCGDMIHIVNAEDRIEALEMAGAEGAWEDCHAVEIHTEQRGCVFQS